MANLKNRHNNLRCSVCGSYDIETLASFQDCNDLIMHDDKYSRLDDYNVLITLFCNSCNSEFPIISINSSYEVGKENYAFLKEV